MKVTLFLGLFFAAASALATAPAANTAPSAQPAPAAAAAKAGSMTEAQARAQCASEKATDMTKCVSDKMGSTQKK